MFVPLLVSRSKYAYKAGHFHISRLTQRSKLNQRVVLCLKNFNGLISSNSVCISIYSVHLFAEYLKWQYILIRRISIDTGNCFKPAVAHKAARWQTQPRLKTLLCLSRIRTELCFPTITLAVSDANPIKLSHGMPQDSNSYVIISNIVSPVAILHIGIAKNRVTTCRSHSFQYLTIIAKNFLTSWSFPPSQRIEKGEVLQAMTAWLIRWGAIACVIIAWALVCPHA